ncbi:MAG: alanyl-tRNA editing protein [Oscillospiraceae bacterium]|nr:alanyl-tRNA editing protein [Oscillospiraceae bacterium]
MTEKLFYQDAFLKEFSGTVLDCRDEKGQWVVVLDRTAFYPEGGGQPADHGTLGGVNVVDVREKDGEVLHFCDGKVDIGTVADGVIDWERRFDFMQQHSGEHIVSGILCRKFGCDNVGFHIGHELVTIDFNAELSTDDVIFVENAANRYIWEDRDIQIGWPSPAELEALEYRSKKALSGAVRIVSWPEADCCACCGTHVKSSGQVGIIKLISCQKFRDGVRIEMAAGGRALRWINQVAGQNTKVSQLLSAKPGETAAAVERLQKDVYALRGRVAELEESDFVRKAEASAGKGDVLLIEGPMSGESLRKLCGLVKEKCGGRCAVFAGADGVYQYAIGQDGEDLRGLAKNLNARLNGRGGGKPEFVQGSVKTSEDEIRKFFLREL